MRKWMMKYRKLGAGCALLLTIATMATPASADVPPGPELLEAEQCSRR